VHTSLQRLNREKAEREQLIHIPENVSLERNTLQKATSSFAAEHGREPSQAELADRTGISLKRLAKISQYKSQAMESQFLSEKGDSLYPSTPGDDQRIWIDYVYHELDPVDQKILEWSTGYGNVQPIPKKEMALRLKISGPAVSARISKIVKKLEEGVHV
jgi:DNA-directed RNA polymerase specialized sigma subunit